MEQAVLEREILPNIFFKKFNNLSLPNNAGKIYEVRLRSKRPVMFLESFKEWFLDANGKLIEDSKDMYIYSEEEIYKTLQMLSRNSIYAYQDEIVNGFITIKGGHRVGIVGKTVIDKSNVKNIVDYSGLNFRISRAIHGCGEKILKYIVDGNQILNTLIISPPACGKTTVLRDLARCISNGAREIKFRGIKVGIVDERSEISASFKGIPQHDVGIRTDVLDGCPKDQGILMLLRTMSPEVIITDEIGNDRDLLAVKKSINSGVKIIASYHGYGIDAQRTRHDLGNIMRNNMFERLITLSFKDGPGTLQEVYDTAAKSYIYVRDKCG